MESVEFVEDLPESEEQKSSDGGFNGEMLNDGLCRFVCYLSWLRRLVTLRICRCNTNSAFKLMVLLSPLLVNWDG